MTVTTAKDGTYGSKKPDGTWGGMVGEVMNETSDIGKWWISIHPNSMQSWYFQITAAAAFSVTIARSEVITFMQPLAVTKKRLFIQNPKQTFNFLAYTQTITNTAWIVIAVTVVVTPFFLYITVRRWAFNIHLLTTITDCDSKLILLNHF